MEEIIKEILDRENITYSKINKATSGFTNLVYFIDDKFVIKISKDITTKKQLIKEISIYKNIKISNIPKFVASGELDSYMYLIITKLNGNSLFSIWHTLSVTERSNCIKQIAKILKEFNNQNTTFLSEEYKELNWCNYMLKELTSKSLTLKELGFNTEKIDTFISNDLNKIFSKNNFGLVYNDAHFDNFIYNNGKLSLIDFDRVMVCPIDYEMLIFKTMCDNPIKFASLEDEDKIKNEDYKNLYEEFKLEYPEMFENEYVETRIAVYQFNYHLKHAIKSKNNNWINDLLNNIKF